MRGCSDAAGELTSRRGQVVHEAMQEAVTEAVQAAVDEGMKFDLRANLYTLVAITGLCLPLSDTLFVSASCAPAILILRCMHTVMGLHHFELTMTGGTAGVVLYWRGIWTTWYILILSLPVSHDACPLLPFLDVHPRLITAGPRMLCC